MEELREALVTISNIGSGEAQQVALRALRKYDNEKAVPQEDHSFTDKELQDLWDRAIRDDAWKTIVPSEIRRLINDVGGWKRGCLHAREVAHRRHDKIMVARDLASAVAAYSRSQSELGHKLDSARACGLLSPEAEAKP